MNFVACYYFIQISISISILYIQKVTVPPFQQVRGDKIKIYKVEHELNMMSCHGDWFECSLYFRSQKILSNFIFEVKKCVSQNQNRGLSGGYI